MLKLTRFENLHRAIQRLGAEQSVERLIKEIASGKKEIDPDKLLYGEDGIFFVDSRGILSRILLHICDKNISSRFFKDGPRVAFDARDFEHKSLIWAIHKYHLINCETLDRAKREGWREKYVISPRRDGRFYYRYTNGLQVLVTNEDQRLDVCGNCIKDLNARWQTTFVKRGFLPTHFFSHEAIQSGIQYGGERQAENCPPNIYARDWSLISEKYRQLVNYQCEGDHCNFRDLSSPNLRRFLHCHHKNFAKSDNSMSNLMALCIHCHAEEPMHELKKTPDYQTFLKISGRV